MNFTNIAPQNYPTFSGEYSLQWIPFNKNLRCNFLINGDKFKFRQINKTAISGSLNPLSVKGFGDVVLRKIHEEKRFIRTSHL